MDGKQWFEILVREHSRMLMMFIRASAHPSIAEDVWQETMLIAWKRIEDFDRTRPFGPWLRGIAAKVLLSKGRQESRWLVIDDPMSLEYLNLRCQQFQDLPGDTWNDKIEHLRDCLNRLPQSDRECILLRYQDGLLPQDLTHRLSMSLEAVKKKLYRAKQRILMCMQSKFGWEKLEHGIS